MSSTIAPAFQDEAADVDGAVVPYLLMDFAVVPLTDSVENPPLTSVVVLAAVAAAVSQVRYGKPVSPAGPCGPCGPVGP